MRQALSLFIILLLPIAGLALPDDNQKPLNVVADSYALNFKTRTNVYEGNVKINQGSTELKTDRLITKSNAQHKMEEAIAYSLEHLSEYSTIPKQGDKLFKAKAKIIKFYPLQSLVQLEGDVVVIQGDNSFHGPVIIYNMKNQTVTAPHNKGGRATILIQPTQLKS